MQHVPIRAQTMSTPAIEEGDTPVDIEVAADARDTSAFAGREGEGASRGGVLAVVVHPGALHLRVGLAGDALPKTVPHVIAWRTRAAAAAAATNAAEVEVSEADLDLLATARDRDPKRRRVDGKKKAAFLSQIASFNDGARPERVPAHNDPMSVEATDVSGQPSFRVGEEALCIHENEPYELFWPFSCGALNTARGRSHAALRGDLAAIWGTVICDKLGISSKNFEVGLCVALRHLAQFRLNLITHLQRYTAVLVVPDIADRTTLRTMVDVLLTDLGFGGIAVSQESVCATFGAGMSTACVVDVGHEKTSVACVDDGVSLPQSRITLCHGGKSVERLMCLLLQRAHFPFRECNPLAKPRDAHVIRELKETLCGFEQEDAGQALRVTEVRIRRPGCDTVVYRTRIPVEATRAPMLLFEPALMSYAEDTVPGPSVRTAAPPCDDPADVFEDLFTSEDLAPSRGSNVRYNLGVGTGGTWQCQWTECSALIEGFDAVIDHLLESHIDASLAEYECRWRGCTRAGKALTTKAALVTHLKKHVADLIPVKGDRAEPAGSSQDAAHKANEGDMPFGLDECIVRSIGAVTSDDLQRRLYRSILLVGGGHQFDGFVPFLESRLGGFRRQLDHVRVMSATKNLDPQIVVWKGAAVLARLPSAPEITVDRVEWHARGMRALRERCAFAV